MHVFGAVSMMQWGHCGDCCALDWCSVGEIWGLCADSRCAHDWCDMAEALRSALTIVVQQKGAPERWTWSREPSTTRCSNSCYPRSRPSGARRIHPAHPTWVSGTPLTTLVMSQHTHATDCSSHKSHRFTMLVTSHSHTIYHCSHKS